MKIKKIKKIKNLVKNDIVIIDISEQQDSGVFSDITDPNVLAIVDKISVRDGIAVILTNGGYEYEFDENDELFYVGSFDFFEMRMTEFFLNYGLALPGRKKVNKFLKKLNAS